MSAQHTLEGQTIREKHSKSQRLANSVVSDYLMMPDPIVVIASQLSVGHMACFLLPADAHILMKSAAMGLNAPRVASFGK